jgi:hypothetical protein
MKYFKLKFIGNKFGFVYYVWDRLSFRDPLKPVPSAVVEEIAAEFPGRDVKAFKVCDTCRDSLVKSKIPPLSSSNGFKIPREAYLRETRSSHHGHSAPTHAHQSR